MVLRGRSYNNCPETTTYCMPPSRTLTSSLKITFLPQTRWIGWMHTRSLRSIRWVIATRFLRISIVHSRTLCNVASRSSESMRNLRRCFRYPLRMSLVIIWALLVPSVLMGSIRTWWASVTRLLRPTKLHGQIPQKRVRCTSQSINTCPQRDIRWWARTHRGGSTLQETLARLVKLSVPRTSASITSSTRGIRM
jgi:hypothetical protein